MIEIKTERLIIRDHIQEDLIGLHTLLSDPEGMYYLQDLKSNTLEDSKANLKVSMDESISLKREKYFFAIILKDSNQYVGEIGVTQLMNCKLGRKFELGYFIMKKHWGKGLVTEAAHAVVNYCFEHLNTMKIVVGCNKDNVGSENIIIKLGMIKEADFKHHVYLHGKLCDRVEYRMLKEEWEQKYK